MGDEGFFLCGYFLQGNIFANVFLLIFLKMRMLLTIKTTTTSFVSVDQQTWHNIECSQLPSAVLLTEPQEKKIKTKTNFVILK